ncbi:Scp160 protein [Maudiozyma humilis]|uniref:Scp160 protein n=1 Tax=Maudiozyma humilis TaxID=51915 RepID=A0AAV5S555_MAUHU|nr:Scp160 protein [Kazachstania humilis]
MSQSTDIVDTSNIASLSTSTFAGVPAVSQQEKENDAPRQHVPKNLPSLKDLPSLSSNGSSAASANGKVAWGPNMKPAASISLSEAQRSAQSAASKPGSRLRTIQENFSLDLQSQLAMTKQELSKLVTAIKQQHNVSMESTLAKNSRTFLISGLVADVKDAKRELIKALTKPINDKFEVPAKCRSVIIGSGGRVISGLSSTYDVKINVAKENIEGSYDADLDDEMCYVTLYGDYESVRAAKQEINKIVREDTKNASITVMVTDDNLLPFLSAAAFQPLCNKDTNVSYYPHADLGNAEVVLQGLRENVKQDKAAVQKFLAGLAADITEQKVKIPAKFQTVIDASELKDKYSVVVKFPTDAGDEFVSFVGQDANVKDAIAAARASSKNYSVDSLDISRAHSNNVQHAVHVALYFNKYQAVLKPIQEQFPAVKITLPSVEELGTEGLAAVNIIISAKSEDVADIKSVRKEIISYVNNITPADTLLVTDLDYELFHGEIKHALLASEAQVAFVQLGDLYNGTDAVLLVAQATNGDDFKPSMQEIQESLEAVNHTLDPLRAKQNALETKTFDIDAAKQAELLGAGSTNRTLLQDDVNKENGHVQFKLHAPQKDQLTIRGDEKSVKLVAKVIETLADADAKKNKVTIEVPSNTVPRLVGNKGSNLQQIREKFDVQVDIPQAQSQNQAQPTPVEVTVTGFDYNLKHAKAYIQAEAKKWADIISKEIVVPLNLHRNVIGPNASYKNRLQDKYSVHINFPRTSEIVTIRGPSRGVKAAYEEMKNLLDFEQENGHKVVMQVPAEHVPRVIGKNGDNINDIRAEFGVELDFLQNQKDEAVKSSGMIDLEITGTRTAIKEAQAKVEQIVKEAADYTNESMTVDHKYHRVIVGAGGSKLREIISNAGGDEIRNKSIDIPSPGSESNVITIQGPKSFVAKVTKQINKIVEDGENSITSEIDVPKERHGALVGPGGMIRRQLESEFNVVINIPNKNETGPVTVTGLAENVAKAEKKIKDELLKDDFDVEIDVPASIHTFVSERGALIQKLRQDNFINVRHGNSSRRATKLNKAKLDIPVEKVRPAEGSEEKVKVTIEEVGAPNVASEEGMIPWRLVYEPIDYDELLGETLEGEGEEKAEKKAKDPQAAAAKKQAALDKATKLIESRIALAKDATYVGYVWTTNFKHFNKIVGPGGSNIKRIRDETGTLINVPRKSDAVNDVVYIRGTQDGVTKAAETIVKALK